MAKDDNTGLKLALGGGLAALLGVGLYYALRKKPEEAAAGSQTSPPTDGGLVTPQASGREVTADEHGVVHIVPGDMGHYLAPDEHFVWTMPGALTAKVESSNPSVVEINDDPNPNAYAMGGTSVAWTAGDSTLTFRWNRQGDTAPQVTTLRVSFPKGMA